MNLETTARWMADRLAECFGEPCVDPGDPVETLVLTILSQNTNDANRDRAYAALLDEFASLANVADAELNRIANTIRIGGLHHQKARSIRGTLRRILEERGELDLSFIDALGLDAAMAWLSAFPGVGKKTAGIVLLFAFGKPYFPVDTHVRRVLTRFGLIAPGDDPHDRANAILPPDPELMRRLHLLLIQLGRTVCRARDPNCTDCPIRRHCRHGGSRRLKAGGRPDGC